MSLATSVKYFGEPGPTPITNSFFGNYSHDVMNKGHKSCAV